MDMLKEIEDKEMLIKIYELLLKHFGKQNWWPVVNKKNKRFEIIVGAILTQNTAWKNVEKAIKNLYKNNAFSRKAILEMPMEKLADIIKPSGYYKQKAKKLKEIAKLKGKITRERLLKVWGIGKETCDAILLYAYNKPVFVIDAYTQRIFSRLGFKKLDYDSLQKLFEENIPKDIEIYKEYHALLDELAKNYCKKKNPLCYKCPISKFCEFQKNKSSNT